MSNYFKVAFYKAKFGDGKLIDDGISIYTTAVNAIGLLCMFQFKLAWKVIKNRYSHVEIWWAAEPHTNVFDSAIFDAGGFAKKSGLFSARLEYYRGEMFTSTMRKGMAGTVIRLARGVLTHPERWDIMEIPRRGHQIIEAKYWARQQEENNLGYNKKTIANFFNPFRPTNKPAETEQNICSVAVQGFCWMAGLFTKWRIWSPIKLWWKLTKLGYETEPLIKE